MTYAGSGQTKTRIVKGDKMQQLLKALLKNRHSRTVGRIIWRIPQYRSALEQCFLTQISREAQSLCSTTSQSYLRHKNPDDLSEISWQALIREWKERSPTMHQVICMMHCKKFVLNKRYRYSYKNCNKIQNDFSLKP